MKHKYLIGILACVLFLFFYLFHLIYTDAKEHAIAELNSRQLIIAKQAKTGIENYFINVTNFLSNISQSVHVTNIDDQSKKELDFALTIAPEAIKAITRVDTSGKIAYTAPYNVAAIGRDISNQKHIQKILKTHRPVVSDVFTTVQGYRAIALHVPVFDKNEFRGTLGVLIDFLIISKRFLQEIRLGETGYAWMTSREGIELYCPVPGHTGKSVFENCKDFPTIISMANKMVKGEKGITSYTFDRIRNRQEEQVKKQAVYLPVNMVDNLWTIVVASSEDEALANLAGFKNKILVVVGLLLLFGFLFSYHVMKTRGIVREATERQKAEAALRESEEKYRLLVESTNDWVWACDIEGRETFANQAIKTILGYEVHEMAGLSYESFLHPEDQKKVRNWLKSAIENKIGWEKSVLRWKHKDGTIRFLESAAQPILDVEGNLIGFTGIDRDITERKQAEEELRESESKFRSLFDLSPQPIALTDVKTGRLVDINNKFCELTQHPKEDLIGKTPTEAGFYSKEDRSIFLKELQTSDKIDELEMNFKAKDGSILTALMFSNIITIGGKPFILTVFNDVTTQKQLEDQLRQAQKMESIGSLAGGIAHDFNNILTSVIGFTELSLDEVEKGTHLEDNLQEIYTAGKRAKDLVSQILAFARQSEEELKPIQVDTIAAEVLKFIRSSIPATIEIKQNIESDSLITGNATQVHQILMNLFTNAAHAMEDKGGILEFGLKDVVMNMGANRKKLDLTSGNYIEIKVSDTGVGIAPEIIGSIFDPYFTTKGPGEGTGMGLAMVHGIIESYGGKISVDSKPGQGTLFTIYLPVTRKRQGGHHPYQPETLPAGTERILFVDDEASIAKMGGQTLERLGYTVSIRTSSIEALELFRTKPNDFDLVITDMTMPNMTGDRLAIELMKIRPDIPVILCTGYSKRISDETATEMGIKTFIYKPIVKVDLAKTVREVLDEAKSSAQG